MGRDKAIHTQTCLESIPSFFKNVKLNLNYPFIFKFQTRSIRDKIG